MDTQEIIEQDELYPETKNGEGFSTPPKHTSLIRHSPALKAELNDDILGLLMSVTHDVSLFKNTLKENGIILSQNFITTLLDILGLETAASVYLLQKLLLHTHKIKAFITCNTFPDSTRLALLYGFKTLAQQINHQSIIILLLKKVSYTTLRKHLKNKLYLNPYIIQKLFDETAPNIDPKRHSLLKNTISNPCFHLHKLIHKHRINQDFSDIFNAAYVTQKQTIEEKFYYSFLKELYLTLKIYKSMHINSLIFSELLLLQDSRKYRLIEKILEDNITLSDKAILLAIEKLQKIGDFTYNLLHYAAFHHKISVLSRENITSKLQYNPDLALSLLFEASKKHTNTFSAIKNKENTLMVLINNISNHYCVTWLEKLSERQSRKILQKTTQEQRENVLKFLWTIKPNSTLFKCIFIHCLLIQDLTSLQNVANPALDYALADLVVKYFKSNHKNEALKVFSSSIGRFTTDTTRIEDQAKMIFATLDAIDDEILEDMLKEISQKTRKKLLEMVPDDHPYHLIIFNATNQSHADMPCASPKTYSEWQKSPPHSPSIPRDLQSFFTSLPQPLPTPQEEPEHDLIRYIRYPKNTNPQALQELIDFYRTQPKMHLTEEQLYEAILEATLLNKSDEFINVLKREKPTGLSLSKRL